MEQEENKEREKGKKREREKKILLTLINSDFQRAIC